MEQIGTDKMMKGDEKSVKQKSAYLFPEQGITVEASSHEEAEAELAKQTSKLPAEETN